MLLASFSLLPPRHSPSAPPPPSPFRVMTLFPMGLLDLPTELLERILFHVADPTTLCVASRTCTRLAAAMAANSPLWPALLRGRIDLTRRQGGETGWETAFFLLLGRHVGGSN